MISKDHFREVIRALRPDLDDDSFNRMWELFIQERDLWQRRN